MSGAVVLRIGEESLNMNQNWKYVKPLENPAAVSRYLSVQKVTLPDTLVAIIENFNGGRPSSKVIVTSNHKEYVFKSLLSYNASDKETIYSVYPDVFRGTSLYPIGSDAAGNFVCYDLSNNHMVLYNHETDKTEDIVRMPFDF